MIMLRYVSVLLMVTGGVMFAYGADLDNLRDSAKWLKTERLRGTLWHNPIVQLLRPMMLEAADPSGRMGAPTPVTLRGWHHLIILPDAQKKVAFKLKDLSSETHFSGRTHFSGSIYAIFDHEGKQVAEGQVGSGEEKTVEVRAKAEGPYILLLNSGPASSNACEVTVLNPHWAIDAKPRKTYNRSPLHYHFLRDLKLGGFNLAMIDFEDRDGEALDRLRARLRAARHARDRPGRDKLGGRGMGRRTQGPLCEGGPGQAACSLSAAEGLLGAYPPAARAGDSEAVVG